MFKYQVAQHQDSHDRLVLQDNMGQFYLVRALGQPPPSGARLNGARPHLGFGLLKCSVSGQVYRVIFESTDSQAAIVLSQQQRTG